MHIVCTTVSPGELPRQTPRFVLSALVSTVTRQDGCHCYGRPPPFLLFFPVASPAIPLLDGPAHPLGFGVSSVISLGAKGLDPQRCREQTATTLDLQDAYCL